MINEAHFTTQDSCEKIFTSLTFNILFDTRRRNQNTKFLQKLHIKHSQERFSHIIKDITQLQPDVITFNEITQYFLDCLDNDEFIHQNYKRSIVDFNPKTSYDMEGNLILIKKNFQETRFQKIDLETHDEPVPIVFFKMGSRKIAVASVHLLAFSKNSEKRKSQLQEILHYFVNKTQFHADVIILQGDMNFHVQSQNAVLNKLGLIDCWLQKYDLAHHPGYTFDSYENTMINELYWGFEQRRMRLDRMLLFQNKKTSQIKVRSINLVLNQAIYLQQNPHDKRFMSFFKGVISFIGDVFGKNWFRTKQKYLFPSDHFGIFAQFQI